MKESREHKTCYYEKMKNKGLGVKLALDHQKEVGCMIEYLPMNIRRQKEKTNILFIASGSMVTRKVEEIFRKRNG